MQNKSTVLRAGSAVEMLAEILVPGDVVVLSAGNVIPAAGRLLSSRNLFVDDAALTGQAVAAVANDRGHMIASIPGPGCRLRKESQYE